MGYALRDLYDLFALARALRRCAADHGFDGHRDLFLDAAAVLEARAFFIASNSYPAKPNQEPKAKAYAPLNLLI